MTLSYGNRAWVVNACNTEPLRYDDFISPRLHLTYLDRVTA